VSPRTPRRLATIVFLMVSLVFAQLALAQYICPVADQAVALEPPPCHDEGQQQSQPALCHQHCTNAPQSFEPVKIPALTLPAIVQVLVVPLRIAGGEREAIAFATKGEAQPPPAPVFLSTLRLRV
jgi:hypothetical protein